MVQAISNVAPQEPCAPQEGFSLIPVLRELLGIGIGAGLSPSSVWNYVPNSWTSCWGTLWHQESNTILSLAVSLPFLLFNFLVSIDWNVSITLFSFTCVQGRVKRIHLDAKSKPWSPSPPRWQFWHIRRVQSRGGHILSSYKKENLCWLSQALFIYTEKTGPNGLLCNGFHKRQLSSVPVTVRVVWIITKLLAILSKHVSTMIWSAEFCREALLTCSVAHSCVALEVHVLLRAA